MTRKDYEAIAKCISETRGLVIPTAYDELARRLAEVFKSDNPRFDVDKFREACK